VCQNLVPLVNIKIAGKWMFIPLKMVLIGIDPYPSQLPRLALQSWRFFPSNSAASSKAALLPEARKHTSIAAALLNMIRDFAENVAAM